MWKIENPAIRNLTFDFSTSGGKKLAVSQIVTGSLVLVNALELVDWEAGGTQVLVCEQCGISGCSPGGWINLRRAADRIFLIPVFAEIESDAWCSDEYEPPTYFRKGGTPYFDIHDYLQLAERHPLIPAVSTIRTLELGEAARLTQLAAPFRMFGEPSGLTLEQDKSKMVIASSRGDVSDYLVTIENLLRTYYRSREPASLRTLYPDEEIISLFVDAAEFVDWQALVAAEGGYRLLLEDELVIEPQCEINDRLVGPDSPDHHLGNVDDTSLHR